MPQSCIFVNETEKFAAVQFIEIHSASRARISFIKIADLP